MSELEFPTIDGTNYPTQQSTSTDPLNLVNPDNVLSGTLRGIQLVGSPNLQIDNAANLITIKSSTTTTTSILRIGQIAKNFLGYAVSDGTNDTMFAGRDSTGATVVKIAKAGYDAKTATNDQLIFNSSQNILKIVGTYTGTFPSLAATTANSWTTNTVTYDTGITSSTNLMGIVQIYDGAAYMSFPYVLEQLIVGAAPNSGGIRALYRGGTILSGGTVNIWIKGVNYDTGGAQGAKDFKAWIFQESAT